MKFNFQEVEKPRLDKLYLLVKYEGGDGDTKHPEEYYLDIKYSELENRMDEITKEIESFKTLKIILNDYRITYKKVKEEYGDEMTNLYDNVPNDPQTDFDTKCYIDDLKLIAYDKAGIKYISNI